MTTIRNRSMTMFAALALAAALLASAGAAQAKGGGHATGGIRLGNINTVSSGPTTVVRDHRGNRNGEGGVTVTRTWPPRPCKVACVQHSPNSPYGDSVVRDHRGR
jgi:hypothetical protein